MVPTPGEEDIAMERQTSHPIEKARQQGQAGDEEATAGQTQEDSTASSDQLGSNKEDEDRWLVTWDRPDDPGDPLNTPGWKKWCAQKACAQGWC